MCDHIQVTMSKHKYNVELLRDGEFVDSATVLAPSKDDAIEETKQLFTDSAVEEKNRVFRVFLEGDRSTVEYFSQIVDELSESLGDELTKDLSTEALKNVVKEFASYVYDTDLVQTSEALLIEKAESLVGNGDDIMVEYSKEIAEVMFDVVVGSL